MWNIFGEEDKQQPQWQAEQIDEWRGRLLKVVGTDAHHAYET